MIKRKIPVSGELLPAIGLGSWIQFDIEPQSPEQNKLLEVLTQMNRSGATLIDSSPMYGKSEERIGDLTGKTPFADQFFYATKVWTTGEQQGITQINDSFKKMKRNTMDLIQVHNLQDWKTHLKTINRLKEEGRVRYNGITHYQETAHDQLEMIIRSEKIDFIQFNYSILTRNAEKSLLPACREKGVAVIINEPFEKGSLFRKVKGKPLPEWAQEMDINNWAAFFLKYILAEEAVNCVIPGTSEPTHMKDILTSGEGRLPDKQERLKMISWLENS